MGLKIETINQSVFHYNYLINPLVNFHGAICSLGSPLPERGIAKELALRTGYAIISLFAYLALAFAAMAGLILNKIWKRSRLQTHVPVNVSPKVPGNNQIFEKEIIYRNYNCGTDALSAIWKF